jgi:hypothetical protein
VARSVFHAHQSGRKPWENKAIPTKSHEVAGGSQDTKNRGFTPTLHAVAPAELKGFDVSNSLALRAINKRESGAGPAN